MINRRGFTLAEVVVAILILSILTAISLTAWTGIMDKSKRLICEQNQIIIMNALKLYIYKNDSVPLSLSKLSPEYTDFAIAYLRKNRPTILAMRKICMALINIDKTKEALATSHEIDFSDYLGNQQVFKCPLDTSGGKSYAYASILHSSVSSGSVDPNNNSWTEFKYLETNDLPIICDCADIPVFSIDSYDTGPITGTDIRAGHRFILTGEKVAVAIGGNTIRYINSAYNWDNPKSEKKYRHEQ